MEKSYGRYIVGLVIIGFGAVALLNNFGVTSISLGYVFNLLWPLLLIAAGVNWITRGSRGDHGQIANLVTGGVLVGVGVLFLGGNAGLFNVDTTTFWKGFWPVIIILIGLNILFKNQHNFGGNTAIMGAVDKTKEVWDLSSGEYTAVMGGIDLDIRKANFTQRMINLDLTAIMGGITIIVPEDVAITCQGTAILGGVNLLGKGSGGIVGSASLQTGDLQNSAKILNLRCTCIMGGIEIKR